MFYAYLYIDPRDYIPFYVGKGICGKVGGIGGIKRYHNEKCRA